MKISFIFSILWLSIQIGFSLEPAEPQYRDAEILVQFREDMTVQEMAALEQEFSLTRLKWLSGIDVYHYQLPKGASVRAAEYELLNDDRVEFAEPNFIRKHTVVYNAPHTNQWYIKNTGQTVNGNTGPAGNDVNWTSAIFKFTTTNTIVVAVLDTGITLNHEDLETNIWFNSSETLNGLDDDGNGLIDDYHGYDFYNENPLPTDEEGHGTQVSGIIGAVSDNDHGIIGICPQTIIMPLQIFGPMGATAVDIVEALEYALNKGARIINCSFGGEFSSKSEEQAFKNLNEVGVLVVCAAGNGGYDLTGDNNDEMPLYPASYTFSNMITVAAVDRDFKLAKFSNYGVNSVQLGAPGTDIYSSDIVHPEVFSEGFQSGGSGWLMSWTGEDRWDFVTRDDNRYLSSASWNSLFGDLTYRPRMDTWAQSPRIDLSTYTNCQLSFRAKYDLADDEVRVEIASDERTWKPIQYLHESTSNNWRKITCDISDVDGKPMALRFRLVSNESSQGYGASIDDISITVGREVLEGVSTNYGFNDGTSFAAPIVSGIAALVLAQRPDLTCFQVKDLILTNTRPVDALKGKVTSGGVAEADQVMTFLGTIPVVITPPSITTGPKDQSVRVGATASFSVVAAGTPPLSYQWNFNGQPVKGATSPYYRIDNVQPGHAGKYAVTVSSPYGSVTSEEGILDVGAAGSDGVIGAPFSYQIMADNNPTVYLASGLPDGLRIDSVTGLISGTPTETGSYWVEVEAKNVYGSATGTILLFIQEGAITSPDAVWGVIGVPFGYQITANNAPRAYVASGLPPGLNLNTTTGFISGTPTETGTYWIDVEAKNLHGSATTNLFLVVLEGSITSPSSAVGILGVPFSYQITADNAPTAFVESGLPPGLGLNTATGLISGIPTETGTNSVFVEAKNVHGSATDYVIIAIKSGTLNFASATPLVASKAGSVQMTWPTKPSYRYQIQKSTDLRDWTNEGDSISGTGDFISYFCKSFTDGLPASRPMSLGEPASTNATSAVFYIIHATPENE